MRRHEIFLFYLWVSQYFVKAETIGAESYSTQSFELVHHSSYPHFVMFYAPWCGHCKRMQPLWDKYADDKVYSKGIKVAKVDCTLNTPLCASEGIKAYPTLLLFVNQERYTFRGNRNIGEFKQFVEKNVKTVEAPSKTFENELEEDNSDVEAEQLFFRNFKTKINEHYTFVDFYAPWCSHCIALQPVWNQLATRFKHNKKVKIAKVDCTTEKEICKKQNIQAYPSLHLYKDGVLIKQYNKERTLKSLVSFIEETTKFDAEIDENTPDLLKKSVSELSLHEKYKELVMDEYTLIFHMKSGFVIVFFYIPSLIDGLEVFVEFSKELSGVVPGIVNCEENKGLCTKLSVRTYPKIIFFENLNDYFPYFGDRTKVGLHAFVKSFKNKNSKDSKEEL
ncbi:thioredoxin domain-containing protein 5-like isoform X1 [Hydra vulgaris]|uniref:Thioredoxin domain-containing protein 5-like isoform X1 n=1 Tax=Hydra vulgaris TaxID=6087 RepID=A0ABM4BS35_HYDVU